MCRSKDDPRGYYRCSGYTAHTRNARRAANRHYRKALAAAVDAQGRPDLADRIRTAPFSAMPALTAAAGLHPTDIAGPTGRVPGMTNNHALTSQDAELVAEVGAATGTGAELDTHTGAVTSGEADPEAAAAAKAAVEAFNADAEPLPADPEPDTAVLPHWDPAELSPEANRTMCTATLDTLRGADPGSDNYESQLADILDRAAAHDAAAGGPDLYGDDDHAPYSTALRDAVWEAADETGLDAADNIQRDAAVLAERRAAEALYASLGEDTIVPRPAPVDASDITFREEAAEAFMPPELDPADPDYIGQRESLTTEALADQHAAVTEAAAHAYAQAELYEHGDARYADAEVAYERGRRLSEYAYDFGDELDRRAEAMSDDERRALGRRLDALADGIDDAPGTEAVRVALGARAEDFKGGLPSPRTPIGMGGPVVSDDEWEGAGLVPPSDPNGELAGQDTQADAIRRPPAPGFSGRTSDHHREAELAAERVGDTIDPDIDVFDFDDDYTGVPGGLENDMRARYAGARPTYEMVADAQERMVKVSNALLEEGRVEESDALLSDHLHDVRFVLARAHDEKDGNADRRAAVESAEAPARELRDLSDGNRWRPGTGMPYSSEHLAQDADYAASECRRLSVDVSADSATQVRSVMDAVETRGRAARAAAQVLGAAEKVPGTSPGRGRAATASVMADRADRAEHLYLALEREGYRQPIAEAARESSNLGVYAYVNPDLVDEEITRRGKVGEGYVPKDIYSAAPSFADALGGLGESDDPAGYIAARSDDELDRWKSGAAPRSRSEGLDATRRLSTVLSRMPQSAADYPATIEHEGQTLRTADVMDRVRATMWRDYAAAREQIAAGDVAGGWAKATSVLAAAGEDTFERLFGE